MYRDGPLGCATDARKTVGNAAGRERLITLVSGLAARVTLDFDVSDLAVRAVLAIAPA